jgi:hypothetical protein
LKNGAVPGGCVVCLSQYLRCFVAWNRASIAYTHLVCGSFRWIQWCSNCKWAYVKSLEEKKV